MGSRATHYYLPMAPIPPAFSKKNRLVGTLEFPWFVLYVVFIWFQEFCALDTSECWNFQDVCASGRLKCWPVSSILWCFGIKTQTLEFRGFLCLQRFRRMLKFSGCDEPKNAGIPKCLFWALKHADFQGIWCLGRVNILDFPGCLDF